MLLKDGNFGFYSLQLNTPIRGDKNFNVFPSRNKSSVLFSVGLKFQGVSFTKDEFLADPNGSVTRVVWAYNHGQSLRVIKIYLPHLNS